MVKRFLLFPLLVLIFLGALLADVQPVRAQTPEPTPVYQYDLALPSGTHVAVVRTITYGEIAVVIAIMSVGVIFIVYFLIRVVRLWLR